MSGFSKVEMSGSRARSGRMDGHLTMREAERLQRHDPHRRAATDAAAGRGTVLGLSERQVRRLYRRIGRAAPRAWCPAIAAGGSQPRGSRTRTRRTRWRLIRERYADFGPTFAHQKLTEMHGLTVLGRDAAGLDDRGRALGARACSAPGGATSPASGAPVSASSFRSTAATTAGSRTAARAARCWSTSTMPRAG